MHFHYPVGATPLDIDETAGLIPFHITMQSELNEWEQTNILDAEAWAFSKKHADFLTIEFLKKLHKNVKLIDTIILYYYISFGQQNKKPKN